MQLGKVVGREIVENKDGTDKVMLLQVEITDPDDVQNVELFRQSGEDYNPRDDARVMIVDLGEALKIAIACDDGIEPSVDPGERELYSIDSTGAKSAYCRFNDDGTVTLNGEGDNAVRFAPLEDAINELKTKLNDLITAYNAHTHLVAGALGGGPGLTSDAPLAPATPSAPDTAPIKIDEVIVSSATP